MRPCSFARLVPTLAIEGRELVVHLSPWEKLVALRGDVKDPEHRATHQILARYYEQAQQPELAAKHMEFLK